MKNLKFAEALNSEVENIVENTKSKCSIRAGTERSIPHVSRQNGYAFQTILKRRTDYIGHSRLCYWHDTTF